MKRLLALLLFVVAPAFAQEIVPGPYIPPPSPQIDAETVNIVYTTLNPPPSGTSYTWTGFINTSSNGGGLSGGNVPGYNSTTGTFLFGYAQGTVTYKLFDSPDWPSDGTMLNGFKYSWEYFNQDFSRGNISANIKVFGLNNSILENYNFGMPKTTNGLTMMSGQIDFNTPYDIADITAFQISFTGKDDRFWAGYYGPQVRAIDVSVLYSIPPPAPYSPNFLYWNTLSGEGGLFTLTETTSVRYGAEGTYVYALLQAGTYECSNGAWGLDPIGGVVKSCDAGTDTAPLANVVDCALNPTDPTCIINSLVDTDGVVDPVEQAIADATDTTDDSTGSDDGSSDGSDVVDEEEEEVLVADETPTEETNLEQLLQDEETADEEDVVVAETTATVTSETVAAISRELTDEEKAAILADAISKNTLEGALSIAADATSAASNANSTTTTSDSSTSTKTTTTTSAEFTVVAQDTSSSQMINEETKQDASDSSSSGSDILETGRQMGAVALASILADSASSSIDSLNQAESVATTSAESSFTSSDVLQLRTDTILADIVVETDASISNTDTSISTEDATSVASFAFNDTSSSSEQIDSFADIMQINIKPDTGEGKDADLEFVQQLATASEQKQDETNNSGFSDDEKITIANDPALANAFNVSPNITNLEVAGVLNQKQEEKSDAEKAADKVVAANAKEQEEINKNYMDADQSGIVAAMGADTDVTSYRTAMIRDNNNWYKPEDIYKGIIIKDNVRGSYFLEKGNTDTYKKMVEEQYK